MSAVSDSIMKSWDESIHSTIPDLLEQKYKLVEYDAKKALSLAGVSYLVTFVKMEMKKDICFPLIPSKINKKENF